MKIEFTRVTSSTAEGWAHDVKGTGCDFIAYFERAGRVRAMLRSGKRWIPHNQPHPLRAAVAREAYAAMTAAKHRRPER